MEAAKQDSPEQDAQESNRSRATALVGLAVGAAALSGAGCGMVRERARDLTGPTPPTYAPLPRDAKAVALATRVLNRVAFGPRPGDAQRVVEMGAAAYIEEQLADKMEEDPAVRWRVDALDVQQTEQDAPDVLASLSDEQLLRETQQAALLRAVYSRRQLRETLADFWTNHFNIYALKSDGRILIPTDTERVLRPHLFGKFRDLLLASAHSPAMLAYLDNQQNRKGVANENYARELLELHTLGVHSGYTQRDIQEVARCFTGWTVTTGFRRGEFTYDSRRHDEGAKYVPFLNLRLAPNGGQKDADAVLERLATHPATARFLATRLCLHYLGAAPDAVVQSAANAFLTSDGDIRATLRPILLDALPSGNGAKPLVKRPLEMVVSALRATAADTDGGANLQKHLAAMGQPLYQWPMPDGFPEKANAWSGSLLARWNFALALAANAIPGTTVDLNAPLKALHAQSDDAKLNALIETLYARPADAEELRGVREPVRRHLERMRQTGVAPQTALAETAALLLAAPLFQTK